MSALRTAVPVIAMTTILTGCAGIQKEDWPTCAAVGGVGGAALGAIESSTYAGYGALIGAGMAAGYCWANGAAQEEATVAVMEEPTPEPQPMPASEPEPAAEPVRVELDVLFDFDSSRVREESYSEIQNVADFMKQYPETSTTVEGHTDSIGTDAYNQRLSQRRADSVRDVMVNQYGIESNRVNSVGYGESRPIADNSTDEGRQLNRRVEAEVEATPQR